MKRVVTLLLFSSFTLAMEPAAEPEHRTEAACGYNLATLKGQCIFIDHLHCGRTAIDDETVFVGNHLPLTTPLIYAAAHDDEDLSSFILDAQPAVNKKDGTGLAPIHALVYNPDSKQAKRILDYLLKRGVALGLTDSEGKNLFHYICRFGHKELFDTVIRLSSAGNLLRNYDHLGKKPEDYLAYCGDEFSKMYLSLKIKKIGDSNQ